MLFHPLPERAPTNYTRIIRNWNSTIPKKWIIGSPFSLITSQWSTIILWVATRETGLPMMSRKQCHLHRCTGCRAILSKGFLLLFHKGKYQMRSLRDCTLRNLKRVPGRTKTNRNSLSWAPGVLMCLRQLVARDMIRTKSNLGRFQAI